MGTTVSSVSAARNGARSLLRFRRRLATIVADGEVRVELEDDFHSFRLVVRHDGAEVLEIDATSYRHPWTSCAAAPAMLQGLVGVPLRGNLFDVIEGQPVREHCTHLFDMACLAIVAASWGRGHDYEIRADIFGPDQMEISLYADGDPRLLWGIASGEIVEPADFAGRSVRGGFAEWARGEQGDVRQAELFMLRRAVMVASGRAAGRLGSRTPADIPAKIGACFAFQPRRLGDGRRLPGWAASVVARGVANESQE